MITTRDQIRSNAITTANLNYVRMGDGDAQKYAEVLKHNSSIEKIVLTHCALTDDQFDIIAKALIERNEELTMLVLDYNSLTPASLAILKELCEKQLVIHLCLYSNDKLLAEKECMAEFAKLAIDNHMAIYITNPLIRQEKYPDIFPKEKSRYSFQSQPIDPINITDPSNGKHQDELTRLPDSSPKPGSTC
jgi:hypothetical protein